MLKKFPVLTSALAVLLLSSCTLSDPSEADGTPGSYRLKALSSYGLQVMKVSYDNLDRITEINYFGDMVYTLTYSGSSSVPTEVEMVEYDWYEDYETEKEVKYICNRSSWTDIEGNTNGFITALQEVETSYDRDGSILDVSASHRTFTYADRHLTNTWFDGDAEMMYSWDNGLLTSCGEPLGEPNRELYTYTYSDTENDNLQWDPNNQAIGPIAITGLFGDAPTRFLKTETLSYSDGYSEKVQYSYSLLPNGLINAVRILDEYEEETVSFNFQYEKR